MLVKKGSDKKERTVERDKAVNEVKEANRKLFFFFPY